MPLFRVYEYWTNCFEFYIQYSSWSYCFHINLMMTQSHRNRHQPSRLENSCSCYVCVYGFYFGGIISYHTRDSISLFGPFIAVITMWREWGRARERTRESKSNLAVFFLLLCRQRVNNAKAVRVCKCAKYWHNKTMYETYDGRWREKKTHDADDDWNTWRVSYNSWKNTRQKANNIVNECSYEERV